MNAPAQARDETTTEPGREALLADFRRTRQAFVDACAHLEPEDMVLQTMSDASPPKWHLAHTSWFFDSFILRHRPGYRPFHPEYHYLFNSYYETVGSFYPRPKRGFLSRPTTAEVLDYRHHIEAETAHLIEHCDAAEWPGLAALITLGINHEQQHLELFFTDTLYNFSHNPLHPAVVPDPPPAATRASAPPMEFVTYAGGLHQVGHDGAAFSFDNERPRHTVFLQDFALGDRLVTNAEYQAFMADDGYGNPALWLSDGWARVQDERWRHPLYWQQGEGGWRTLTLYGPRPLEPAAPVAHLSYYEADAYARWAGCRLPTEAEWEVAAATLPVAGNLLEKAPLLPLPAERTPGVAGQPAQLFGDLWEWTASPYAPYPGFAPEAGSAGEYNGKFMCSQMVLRGGSCVTPQSHIRPSYRNFFPPHARWQFSGLRLARDN